MLYTEDSRPFTRTACEMLMRVFEDLPNAFFFLEACGQVFYANRSACLLTGISLKEMIGQSLTQVLWPTSSAAQKPFLSALALSTSGKTTHFETLIQPQQAGQHYLEATLTPQMTADYRIDYLVFAGVDVTVRHRSEAELRTLIDAIPQLVWSAGSDGVIDMTNRRWRDYTGTSEQAHADSLLLTVHPADRSLAYTSWLSGIQAGEAYEHELRLRNGQTGEYRWFLLRATPFQDEHGAIFRWFGTCTDIHKQKQVEQKLTESREHLHVLTETMPQLVWTTRADGLSDFFNQRFLDYTQATFSQLHGYGWSSFLHPDDHQRTLSVRSYAFKTGIPYEVEYRLRDGKSGEYRWFLARAMPVRDVDGTIVKWYGTCTDIDEQKRIEEALRQSQQRIRALIDSNIIGIVLSQGEEDLLIEANDAFLHMTGYTQADVQAQRLCAPGMFSPEALPLYYQSLKDLQAKGQILPFEMDLVCKDGSHLPVLVGGVTVQKDPCQTISFVLDNSARKELEQRKDDFISMASHELRNPLAAVKLQTDVLAKNLRRQGIEISPLTFSRMEAQVEKVTRLVDDLLNVSKMQAGRLEYRQEPVQMDELVQEVVETLRATHPSHAILVQGSLQTTLLGDRDRLGQVLINVLTNAIKYSPGAATVEVDLSASTQDLSIRIRDHGPGIPRELRGKIFERFYRVASRQRGIPGLGIGLYIVAEIVRHHGGTITVESEPGQGSTFILTFPLA